MLAPAGNRTSSLDTEKRWVRSYMNEAYLWYQEVPNVDATLAQYSNPNNVTASLGAYFDALLTTARTPSGKLKDEFSFIFPTAEWNALSQGGTSAGYGIEWILGSPTPPRNLRVAYVDPATPAATAAVTRGARVVSINGISIDDVTPAGIATINEGAFSPRPGTTYTFVLESVAGARTTVPLAATTVTKVPVQNAQVLNVGASKVGYLTFNDHIFPAEGQLAAAFANFAQQGVSDLVLDLRYNGGGFIYIASQVGYMIAGATRTSGKTFEKLRYNDKRTADNNDPDNNIPFYPSASGFPGSGTTANTALPQLNLSRVFILATAGSCSASESIINGLRGIDVDVILIGRTTCGKPFGFTAKDNCGISYFPIEFQGTNDKGFGDFADGFAATCAVADDLSKPLGDPTEGMLAAALTYRLTGACPPASAVQRQAPSASSAGKLVRHPVRESKYR
jgi:carboxyl-terminal processing protease